MGKPSLVPVKLVEHHARCCKSKSGRCGLCHWHLKRSDWLRGLRDSKWAKIAVKGKFARVGCTYCCLAETGGPWADFSQSPLALKGHSFRRHEESNTHKKAVVSYKTSEKTAFGPPREEFQECLTQMSKGGSCRGGKCMSDKTSQMRWCLSEAVLSLGRDRLKVAKAISVMRDERKGRLLLRYRAALADLTVTSGVLGYVYTEGFSDSIAQATTQSVSDFCTPYLSPPRQFRQKSPTCSVDQSVLVALQDRTQVLITDAAAPELLASQLLAGKRKMASTGEAENFFKRVKVTGRDATHASTRVLKRPFLAHPVLESMLNEFVSGKESFSQKIQHSPLYQQWYQQSLQEGGLTEAKPSSNLSAAKHRFASYLNPLTKICKHMPAMIQVCHKIATVRSDSAAGWASRLLQNFTGKKAVLLGLIADAASSCGDLTRWLDTESVDICEVNSQVYSFVCTLRTLFGAQQVLKLPTYTKHVLDDLARRPIQILHGCAREVTVSDQDIRAAMNILQEASHVSGTCLQFP